MNFNKIFKNASWIILSKIIQAVLNLIITIFLARFLGPSNFGVLNYAASIVTFAVPIMNLGLTSILVQELVNHPNDEGKILGTAMYTSFVSSIFTIIGIFAFVSIANYGETETIIVCLLYSTMLIAQAFDVFIYWFQAKLLSKYTSIVSLIAYIIISLYKFYLLFSGKSVRWFALSNVIDFSFINISLYLFYKLLHGKKLRFSYKTFKKMINKSKYYIISGMMISIFSQTDRIMLKLLVGDEATGLYSAAITSATMVRFIVSAILDSARPVIFESKNNPQKFERNVKVLYSIIIYFAIFQSLFTTIFSKLIIYIMYGNDFMDAVPCLMIVTWYCVFSYVGSVRNIWLLAENKQSYIWKIDSLGAIANIILNFIFIPLFGINGAALASLLTQAFTNVILLSFYKDIRVNLRYMREAFNIYPILSILKKQMNNKKGDLK